MIKEFYTKTVDILKQKEDVFQDIAKEKGLKNAVIYFSLFTILFVLVSTNYYLQKLTEITQQAIDILGLNVVLQIPNTIQFAVIFAITFILSLIAMTFLKYWIIHLFVKIFKIKSTYQNTYKALSYSVGPGYLAMPFFLLCLAIFPMLDSFLTWLVFLISFAFAIVLEGYGMYLRSVILSKIQKISVIKSFIAIYILGFLTWNLFIIGATMIIIAPMALIL